MIFVFLDDSTLDVTEPDNLAGYEGVDVEAGDYAFFGAGLRTLEPTFTKPNETGKLFGLLDWVRSGEYDLVPGAPGRQDFLDRLARASAVNPNPWFGSLEAVRDYARRRSE